VTWRTIRHPAGTTRATWTAKAGRATGAVRQGRTASKRGEPGPEGKPGRKVRAANPGRRSVPSIEDMRPWLHMIFDAWEEHRKARERETAEREAMQVRDAPS